MNSLDDSANPFYHKMQSVSEIGHEFQEAIKAFQKFPPLPQVKTHYNPFESFEEAASLEDYQRKILKMPSFWKSLLDNFEDIMLPETRVRLYNEIRHYMATTRASGRGWYSSDRSKSGVVSGFFAVAYKCHESYARIFPTTFSASEVVLEIKQSNSKEKTFTTIANGERHFKIFCLFLLNGLIKQSGVQAQLIEINIISCRSRVLSFFSR